MLNAMPVSVEEAVFYGFNCAQCGSRSVRTPVRYNESGPYFDTFLCAWDYQAEQLGDEHAAECAAKVRAAAAKHSRP